MMGLCSWWLPLVAVLPLIRIAPVYGQHREDYRLTLLLAIKNSESGLEIHTRFPENCDSEDSGAGPRLEPKTLFISGRSLSSECGDRYFRCQHLLVENLCSQNASGDFNIVFVPLENGVLLLSYWFDLNNMTMENSSFIVNSSNCSPTVFYKINSKIYTVCISSYSRHFAIYEVQLTLSGSVIDSATLTGPLTEISISASYSNLTNFVLVEQMIYFAVDNNIAVMDIFDSGHEQTKQYPASAECTQIHKLVSADYAENQQLLLAYCTDRYIYFDPVHGDWTTIQLFSNNGIPYLCPDNSYRATFFIDGILRFSSSDLLSSKTNNVNISSGICFESQNKTYFAYSDQQQNSVYVYDFTTQNLYPQPVAPYDCTYQDCPLLLLLENQYLIIQDANHNLVLDTTTNFSLIINISSGIADILAVLHSNVYSPITPSPTIIHSTTTAKVPSAPVSPIHNILVGVISAAVIVMIVVLVSIIIGFSIRYWRRKWYNSAYRIPRMRFITNPSPPVPLLAADNAQEEEEEEGESYEMESVMNLREPRHFGKGWRLTTTV